MGRQELEVRLRLDRADGRGGPPDDRRVRRGLRQAEQDRGARLQEGVLGPAPKKECPPCSRKAPDPFSRSTRSEEHTSELQSLMRTSYAVFCLKKKTTKQKKKHKHM